tara:strand:- start:287 stop:2392 length:2106 start_codon:yes stop_codon:yes gene_type:complete
MAENNNIPQGANKYSVYAQRNVESTQVDWNKIAGELTKGAEAIRDERQGRKDAIDLETQNSMEQLSKVEGTNNQDAASLLINGSSMSVEALRVQTDMLKRGLIKPKDYKLFMQQQKTGYANLNTAVKGWDKWATEANERLKTAEGTLGPKAGGLEIYQNNLTSALGNLKNKKLWSNPINGQLQLVTMGKDKGGSYNVMPDYYKNKAAYQNPNTMNDLMKYQQDRFDLKNATKGITSKVGQIIKAFVSGPKYNVLTGAGAIKTVSDFRQFGEFGSDLKGNKITYDQWKEKQIDTITGRIGDESNENAGQILFNSGGYKYAQTIEEFREDNPNLDESYWIETDNSGSRPEIKLSDKQMKEARSLADTEIESQIAHVETLTKGSPGQQKQQDTANTTRAKKEEDKNKAYFGDINTVITGLGTEGAAVSEDRITDMNQRFLDSKNSTDKNTKINSIERGANEIVIDKTVRGVNKPVTVDKFFRDPKTDELDLKRPLTSKDIARKIYRELIPRAATKDMSFDDFYDAALKSGMDFTPKEIEDADGNMIPNPEYGGDEAFSTKTQIEKISLYSSDDFTDLNQTKSLSLEFQAIPSEDDNQEKAAPVVLKAFNKGLDKVQRAYGSSLAITVDSNDEWGGENTITVKYKDPVTGKVVDHTFKYNDDNTKLQSEVDAKINEIIDAYNTSRASGEDKPVVSEETEDKPDMG